jgi:hypothetical protein
MVPCPRCGISVRTEFLQSHVNGHYTVVKCGICGDFVRSDALLAHEARHTPNKTRATGQPAQPLAPRFQQFCRERAIPSLVHFTRLQNLTNILEKGLLSRLELEKLSLDQQPPFNDPDRLDECRGAVCLSIAFPNYKLFYRYGSGNRVDWVVLLLNVAVLWELDCAFCQENAASSAVRRIALSQRKQLSALKAMFADYPGIRRKVLDIPTYYPTHPQAEVLVFKPIPPHYITAVHFWSPQRRQQWLQRHPGPHEPQLLCSDAYFKYRPDWQHW